MFEFFWYVWQGIVNAMALNPRVAEVVAGSPESGTVVLVISILGGAGLLLGQSVILFVNRVRPARFALSLLLNGIVFAIGLMVWGVTIWLIGMILFPSEPSLGSVMRLVGLAASPYVFGLFVLIPYLGEFIHRVLGAWSVVIAAGATAFSFQVGWWAAFVVVGLSWVLINAMSNTIGRPVLAMRNRAWQRVAGTSLDASVSDILTQFASQSREEEPRERIRKP